MSTTAPILSIVIPAYNEEAYLPRCLKSVHAEIERCGLPIETIVIDNASTDPTKGLTYARERGLLSAHAPLMAHIDADMEMPPGWITNVLRLFAKYPDAVCVSGPHVHYDAGRMTNLMVWLYWIFLAKPSYWCIGYMAVGGNFTAKKAALEKIGGFDTSITFYGEDTNIARRLAAVGKVRFVLSHYIFTSARRLHEEGILATAFHYMVNFLSEVAIKKAATKTYRDIR